MRAQCQERCYGVVSFAAKHLKSAFANVRPRRQAAARKKGHLKIFLGYASGVGKSFRMLDEARRRRERGQDIVVGAMQPQVPAEVEPLLRKLEVIPLRTVGGGTAIDVDASLLRHPSVCIIDGLAYDNPPGSRNPTRWQDVKDLLRGWNSSDRFHQCPICGRIARTRWKQSPASTWIRPSPLLHSRCADEIEIVDAPPEEPMERSPDEQVQIQKTPRAVVETARTGFGA